MTKPRLFITATVVLAAALPVSLSAAAWAKPGPLTKSEIATGNTAVQPNPDQQRVMGASAGPVCSEVCSGGAVSQRPGAPETSGAALAHDSRPRSVAVPALYFATHNGGFHWDDAGVGAGAVLVVTLIGLAGAAVVTHRRRIHHARAS